MKLSSRLCAITAAAMISALEAAPALPQEIVRYYAQEKQSGEQQLRFTFPEYQGTTRIDVRLSSKAGEFYQVRNRLDSFYLRDGRIETVKRQPQEPSDYWSAILNAERLILADAPGEGKEISFSSPLPGPLPERVTVSMRTPGKFLLPIPLPNIAVPPGISMQTVGEFRKLAPSEESAWLRRRLESIPESTEALSLLDRMAVTGEFRYPMSAVERDRCKALLLNPELGVAPRRRLQKLLFEANFLAREEFAAELLMDPLLGPGTAEEFATRNPAAFETLLVQWSRTPALQPYALPYTDRMAFNPGFRGAMLKAFSKPEAEQLPYLIALYCCEYSGTGSPQIKELLQSKKPIGQQLLNLTAEWILKTSPQAYAPEIRQFLHRERHNRQLERSVAYPLLLASLCRSGEEEGIRQSIAYLKELKEPAQIENARRIWGKGMTGNVTLERIIHELENRR